MPYKGQVNPHARKRVVKMDVSNAEYAVLRARADAHTQGNVARYIREQLFGADADAVAQGEAGVTAEPVVQGEHA